jgi:hypothetical protein
MMEDATQENDVTQYQTIANPMVVRKNPRKVKNTLLRLDRIRVDDIIKQLSNGHALIYSKTLTAGRSGVCLQCMKNQVPQHKLYAISSFCPACKGCSWICETCFDTVHGVVELLYD